MLLSHKDILCLTLYTFDLLQRNNLRIPILPNFWATLMAPRFWQRASSFANTKLPCRQWLTTQHELRPRWCSTALVILELIQYEALRNAYDDKIAGNSGFHKTYETVCYLCNWRGNYTSYLKYRASRQHFHNRNVPISSPVGLLQLIPSTTTAIRASRYRPAWNPAAFN